MYHFRSKISLACCFFLFITIANAQWNKIQTGKNFTNIGKANATIYNASLFNADAEKLKDLKALPVVQDFKDKQSASIIEIPLPDGSCTGQGFLIILFFMLNFKQNILIFIHLQDMALMNKTQ